ncbi:tetratricopeptide repeat protein [Deinococcus sp. 14RED07]|uniref:tetratricopeptide repeat protein n=1 Tax=Deinococcus sp. 14RED07 TaxID=2745874 RepID=UPI0027146F59|nr:tetratricopeptide repeat protein [Deinococcus sp. 14RED07]MCD0176453.1 tetratricopeptide repeat protein [Deinococcus sp. 14RED07]
MPDADHHPLDLPALLYLLDEAKERPEAALPTITGLLAQAKAEGNRAAEQLLLTLLGAANLHSLKPDLARKQLDEALRMAGSDPEQRARALTRKLELFVVHGETDTLEDDYRQLEQNVGSLSSIVERVVAFNILGNVDYFQDDFTKALSWFEKTKADSKESNYPTGIGRACVNIGVLDFTNGKYATAMTAFKEALTLLGPQVAVQNMIAFTFKMLGQIERARPTFQQMVEILSPESLSANDLMTLTNYVDALYRAGEHEEAIAVIERFGVTDTPVERSRAALHDTLGYSHAALGRPDEARRFFMSSIEIYDRLAEGDEVVWPLLGLAELELERDPEVALAHASRSLSLLDRPDTHRPYLSRTLNVLSKVHAARGDYREAYGFAERHRALQAELDREAERQRLEVALAELEFDRAQAVADIQRTALGQARGEVAALHAQLEARVQQRTQELQAANEELTAFAWSLSHYLRTPMQLVMGHADLLVTLPEAERAAHAEGIMQSIGRMSEMLDGLLRYAERHLKPLESRPVPLAELVQGAWTELAPGADVQLVTHALPVVMGDAAALRLVFRNLLANATQHSRRREGARVVVRASLEGGMHVIEVQDNGVGFDPEAAQRLFRVFSQLPAGQSFEGLGLGLADVWRVVIAHGGHVRTEGRPGEGASFFVSLPAAPGQVLGAPASA